MTNKGYLSNLGKRIDTDNKPIIFWDTCSLLNIIRVSCREEYNSSDLEAYRILYDKIKHQEIYSVSSELVLHEYNSNIEGVRNEYTKYIKKLNDGINKHLSFVDLFTKTTAKRTLVEKHKLINNLEKLLYNIHKKTYYIKEEKRFNKFAHFRVKNHMAPAAKKGEYKDCYIWGTCLSLADRLKQSNPIFFLTANTSDFFIEKKNLQPHIENDCTTNNVKVIKNCGELIGFLGKL